MPVWLKWLCGVMAALSIAAVALVFGLDWLMRQPCSPPTERPAAVPKAAFWSGGCDGGAWMAVTKDAEKPGGRALVSIMWDAGETAPKQIWFAPDPSCVGYRITQKSLAVGEPAYDGTGIILARVPAEGGRHCRLIPLE
jgi:hypothetical protein